MTTREVDVEFSSQRFKTEVVEIFEAENQNSVKKQQQGWQTILDNFKKYVEENSVWTETNIDKTEEI